MMHVSREAYWWGLPGFTAGVCAAAAVSNFVTGSWITGAVLLSLGFVTLMSRRTEVHAYRAGYWRGSYEEMTHTRPPGAWDGWQPSPWDDPPPPPWELPIGPTQH
jgi:hypothetical protein